MCRNCGLVSTLIIIIGDAVMGHFLHEWLHSEMDDGDRSLDRRNWNERATREFLPLLKVCYKGD
jgi:hypothetical protein